MFAPSPSPSFSERLVRDWYLPRRTLLTSALTPLGWIFRIAAASRRFAYRFGPFRLTRVSVPVIVVGNITVGGTGKTPVVLWLAEQLTARGRKPGIISRGYGSEGATPRRVDPSDDAASAGDEPLLLAASGVPVWIGRDRAATAQRLVESHSDVDVIVSDDGLQHYALLRDFEIVVVDGARGFGNGALLPAGPLREPVSRLDSVDAVIVNGADFVLPLIAARTFTMTLRGDRFENLVDRREAGAESLRTKRVHAVAGIGNPQRFFDALRALGVAPKCHPFPDHHRFKASDLALPDAEVIVMTEKDAIKCASFADARMWALPVVADLSDAGALLLDQILEKIDGPQAA